MCAYLERILSSFCLQLVAQKVISHVTSRRRHQLPTTAMLIDGVPVTPVQNVRDLGIYIDGNLSMRTHVQLTTSSCFAALRRQIRRFVPTATF